MDAGAWSWLEVAKLAASLVTPVVVAVFGVYIHRVTKRFEHSQWRSQKLIEKRLVVYDDLAPLLNDLLCFFTYVGAWKEMDPPTAVGLKRKVDKKVHLAAPLFSPRFFGACMTFQNLCFETYVAWGLDARLRSEFKRRKEAWDAKWDAGWEQLFSDEASDPKAVRAAYRDVMEAFAADLGVLAEPRVPHSGRVPGNIK
jgi:hypothetical protein